MKKKPLFTLIILLLLFSLACSTFSSIFQGSKQDGQQRTEQRPPADTLSSPDEVPQGSSNQPEEFQDKDQPNPLNVTAELDPEKSTTTLAWPDENTELSLTLDDGTLFILSIPEGAVASPVELKMTAVSSLDGLPNGVEDVQAVQLKPEGLVLLKPAYLIIETNLEEESSAAFGTYAFGAEFHFSPYFREAGRVEIPLIHFSDYGMLKANQQVVRDIQKKNPPIEEAGRYSNQLSNLMTIDDVVKREEAYENLFLTWYLEIEPILRVAETDSSEIDNAVAEYLQWYNMLETAFTLDESAYLPELFNANVEAKQYLANGLYHAIKEALSSCYDDPDLVVRILRWASVVDYLGLWKDQHQASPAKLNQDNLTLLINRDCLWFYIRMDSTLIGKGDLGTWTFKTFGYGLLQMDEERFRNFSLNRGYLDIKSQNIPIIYDEFSVKNSVVSCSTSTQDGELSAAVLFDLNLYSYPPRLGNEVLLTFRIPSAPEESMECGGYTRFEYKLWNDITLALHQRELNKGKNWFVVKMDVINTSETYAIFKSERTEEDVMVGRKEAAQNPSSGSFSTLTEVLTIKLTK
jgi:hypothetical protein